MMWFKKSGECDDVCISTRIRLARNIEKIPFPPKYTDEEALEITKSVREALKDDEFNFLNLDNAPEKNVGALVEEHIISPEMKQGKNKSVLINKEETVSIMLGEEDHIRLQVILPGFDLKKAYEISDKLDDKISKKVKYAYHEEYGFLTKCPTNAGTGLRASVMLYLPAIRMAGKMNSLIGEVGKMGLTFRGVYGEGTGSKGDMYQLSNQITLGISEEKIIEKLESIAKQIIKLERDLRENFLKERKAEIEDSVYRAYGILKYAKRISSEECSKLLSTVKLGICLGLIDKTDLKKINELIITTEPYHISLADESIKTAEDRDRHRALLVNNI